MSAAREGKRKKKVGAEADGGLLSWQQKKILADKEDEVVGKEVEELLTWTSLIEAMDEQQLKEYLLNRPESLKTVKLGKETPRKRVQRNAKPKCSTSSGLMATIWKYHRDEDDEASSRFKV